MSGKYVKNFLYVLVVPPLLLAACQPAAQSAAQAAHTTLPSIATPTRIPTATPPETMTPESSSLPPMPAATQGEGLTFEEMRSTTPPAPVGFSAVIRDNVIHLEWTPAPLVILPHAYSDKVIGYNIYRYEKDLTSLILLATVNVPFYEDKSASPGATYYYSVSAVHEGPLEGERTDDISITAP